MTWSSRRRDTLPSDWAKRRQQVKHRAAGRCQADEHEPRCDGWGAECDHVGDPMDHSLNNLQWLSAPCHAAKTQRQAAAARAQLPRAKRAPERHPGLT